MLADSFVWEGWDAVIIWDFQDFDEETGHQKNHRIFNKATDK